MQSSKNDPPAQEIDRNTDSPEPMRGGKEAPGQSTPANVAEITNLPTPPRILKASLTHGFLPKETWPGCLNCLNARCRSYASNRV